MRIQQVKIGRLANGQWGLFTNGMLASSISYELVIDRAKLLAHCERMGFELVDTHGANGTNPGCLCSECIGHIG